MHSPRWGLLQQALLVDRRLIRKEEEKKLLEEVNTNQHQIKDLDKNLKTQADLAKLPVCKEAFFLALEAKRELPEQRWDSASLKHGFL